MADRLYSANELATQLLPGADMDTSNAFAIGHVSAAIENLAEWKLQNQRNPQIDLEAIVREVKEMSMSWQSKNDIVQRLQTDRNQHFKCEWALTSFSFNGSGFKASGVYVINGE